MAYAVEIAPAAKRPIRKLEHPVQERIVRRLDALAEDPHPQGIEKLEGDENIYRVRVGEYRIVYEIREKVLVILVLKVGPTREVYRQGLTSSRLAV